MEDRVASSQEKKQEKEGKGANFRCEAGRTQYSRLSHEGDGGGANGKEEVPMSSGTTSKNGDWGEQAGSSGAEGNERQVQPCAEDSCRPAARPNLMQELAARTGCAVSASGSESGVSPSSSMGDVPPFAPAPSPAGSAPPCSSYLLQQLASSCSFPNSLDGVQSTCHSSPCGGPASSMQLRSSPSAAASFFARWRVGFAVAHHCRLFFFPVVPLRRAACSHRKKQHREDFSVSRNQRGLPTTRADNGRRLRGALAVTAHSPRLQR
ncbi:hypothetical protein MRX96_041636 [Rhipicephalus microplus]